MSRLVAAGVGGESSVQLPPDVQGPCVDLAHKLADAAAAITRQYFRCAFVDCGCSREDMDFAKKVCAQEGIQAQDTHDEAQVGPPVSVQTCAAPCKEQASMHFH
eukprot:1158373-Pelagomonas_calceolata.AAC.3